MQKVCGTSDLEIGWGYVNRLDSSVVTAGLVGCGFGREWTTGSVEGDGGGESAVSARQGGVETKAGRLGGNGTSATAVRRIAVFGHTSLSNPSGVSGGMVW